MPDEDTEHTSENETEPSREKIVSDEDLEHALIDAEDQVERNHAFERLARHHQKTLVRQARLRAYRLGLRLRDGDAVLSEVFAKIASRLNKPWPQGQSFLEHFQRQTWSGLRHRRTDKGKRRKRYPQLDWDAPWAVPTANPCSEYIDRIQLAQRWELVCKENPHVGGEPRLLYARGLRRIGYRWSWVKTEVSWSGSMEELRASAYWPEVLGPREHLMSYARLLNTLSDGWKEIASEVGWHGSPDSLRVSVYKFLKRHPRVAELLP